jgi:hypothetical protein
MDEDYACPAHLGPISCKAPPRPKGIALKEQRKLAVLGSLPQAGDGRDQLVQCVDHEVMRLP